MKYETMPVEVEAHQQQLVSANVPFPPNGIATANPGDWIVKWPDGRLEVFTSEAFKKRFRFKPDDVKASDLRDAFRRAQEACPPKPGLGGIVSHPIGPVTFLGNTPIGPLTPKCEGAPHAP